MARPVCVIGNANLDIVMGPLENWPERGTEAFLPKSDFRIGGSAANTALALRRLNVTSGLVGGCGTDAAGAILMAAFADPLDRIIRFPTATGVSVGVLFPDAERSFLSNPGHLAEMSLDHVLAALADWPLDGAIALVSGAFALPASLAGQGALLDHLRIMGAQVAIDPGWPDGGWTAQVRRQVAVWAARADHVLLNDKELAGLSGCDQPQAGLAWLADRCGPATTLVAKAGAQGCFARQGAQTAHALAQPLAVFDTVGAGDAFNAGYLAAIARGDDLRAALCAGNAIAGQVVAQFPRVAADVPLALPVA
jgi:ribokinase